MDPGIQRHPLERHSPLLIDPRMKTNPVLADTLPSFIAAGILLTALQHAKLPLYPSIFICGALGAFCVYTVDHAIGTPCPTRFQWFSCYLAVFTACIAIVLTLIFMPGIRVFGIVGYILLSVCYVIPLLPGRKRLQDFPILRTGVILFGWAGIPFLITGFTPGLRNLAFIFSMGAFLLPAILLQDHLEAAEDQASGRKTFGGSLSTTQTETLCNFSITLSLFGFLFFVQNPWLILCPFTFKLALLFMGHKKTALWADVLLLTPLVIGLLQHAKLI
jgi:hypothetical protein